MLSRPVFVEAVGIPSERILFNYKERPVQRRGRRGHFFWHDPETAPLVPEEVWAGTNADNTYWHSSIAFTPEQLREVDFTHLDMVLEPHDGGVTVGRVESAWLHETNRNLAVLFSVNTETPVGQYIVDAIRAGHLSGLSVQCRHQRGKGNRWAGTTFHHFAICIEPYYNGCVGMTVKASAQSRAWPQVAPICRIVDAAEVCTVMQRNASSSMARVAALFEERATNIRGGSTSSANGHSQEGKMQGNSHLVIRSSVSTMSGQEPVVSSAATTAAAAPEPALAPSSSPATGMPLTEVQLQREMTLLKDRLRATEDNLAREQAAREVEVAANARLREERTAGIYEKVSKMHPLLIDQIAQTPELKQQIVDILGDPDKSAAGNFVTQSCSALLFSITKERDDALEAKIKALEDTEKLRDALKQSEQHAQTMFGVHIDRSRATSGGVEVSASASGAPMGYKPPRTLPVNPFERPASLLSLFDTLAQNKRGRQPEADPDALLKHEAPYKKSQSDLAVNASASAAPAAPQGTTNMADLMLSALQNRFQIPDY